MKRSDEPAKRAITATNLEIDGRASMGANSELSEFQSALGTALGEHWKWFVFQGIVMLVLRCLAVAEPVIASVAADIYIGWLFLFSGLLGLVTMFSARDASAFFWILLTSALSLAVGILLIWKPDEGTVSLTLVLTAFFIAEGAFRSEPRSPIAMSRFLGQSARKRNHGSRSCGAHHLFLAAECELDARPYRGYQFDLDGTRNSHDRD
jgi:hypothetical protein